MSGTPSPSTFLSIIYLFILLEFTINIIISCPFLSCCSNGTARACLLTATGYALHHEASLRLNSSPKTQRRKYSQIQREKRERKKRRGEAQEDKPRNPPRTITSPFSSNTPISSSVDCRGERERLRSRDIGRMIYGTEPRSLLGLCLNSCLVCSWTFLFLFLGLNFR